MRVIDGFFTNGRPSGLSFIYFSVVFVFLGVTSAPANKKNTAVTLAQVRVATEYDRLCLQLCVGPRYSTGAKARLQLILHITGK